ncbi:MAG: MBL fold metallo-hydrolase [Candidatus Lokiarchaeota archaeon]|nr:MBL fold metallo-hydrolase [Candidatus Lokiarchaeota archaeon]
MPNYSSAMIEEIIVNEQVTCIKTGSISYENRTMWACLYKVENALIDCGCANAKDELVSLLNGKKIDFIYVTHGHEDHYGCCSAFSETATIFAPPRARDVLLNPPNLNEFFQWVWGQPEPVKQVQITPSQFQVGDLCFDTVKLPGHGEEMVGFYEKEKGWLFSADAVPLPSHKQISMTDENIPQMMRTMEYIMDLDVKVLFDGHLGPIETPESHIQKRLDYLNKVRETAMRLHEKGLSSSEIIAELGWESPWYMDMTMGRFSLEHMIDSLFSERATEKP